MAFITVIASVVVHTLLLAGGLMLAAQSVAKLRLTLGEALRVCQWPAVVRFGGLLLASYAANSIGSSMLSLLVSIVSSIVAGLLFWGAAAGIKDSRGEPVGKVVGGMLALPLYVVLTVAVPVVIASAVASR